MFKPYTYSLQLYSGRNFHPLDEQLRLLASLGYDAVEPHPDIYQDAVEMRRLADKHGLIMPSAMTTLELLNTDADAALEAVCTLGSSKVVIPWIAPDQRPVDLDGWKRMADSAARHADRANAAGLELCWHNHDFEYVHLSDGLRPIDHILAAGNVWWEADIGWLQRAGCDIDAELAQHGRKLKLVHVKDVAPAGTEAEGGWSDPGKGVIQWVNVWERIHRTKAQVLVAEHDDPSDFARFAATAIAFMRQCASEAQ